MKTFALLLLGSPLTAFAGSYQLLAPLPPFGPATGGVTLAQYLEGIMQVTIGVAGILAVIMIVICGIQMMGSPSVSQRSTSKECIWNAIFGLLLAAASWIVLNTINTDLLKNDIVLGSVPALPPAPPPTPGDDPMPVGCDVNECWYYRYRDGSGAIKNSPKFVTSASCIAVKDEEARNGVTIVDTPAGSGLQCFRTQVTTGDEATIRNLICGNTSCVISKPVGIKQGPCPPGVGNCAKAGFINVAGMPGSAIDAIKALPGPVVITGGTESGHATHKPNAPIFDLRKTGPLDTWIRTNSTQSAASFYPCRYRLTLAGNDFWFTDEGDHWHTCQLGQPYWFCTDKDKLGNTLPSGTYALCPRK